MSVDFDTNDFDLKASHVGQLESAEQVVHFFAMLDYDVDRSADLDHAALGLDSEDLRQQIRHIRLVGADPVDGEVVVYLLEVRSVTVQLRQQIARRFRERPESALLVLTRDYESLDFVLLEKERERSKSLGRPFRLVVRPRPLTVERRNPSRVALRVLKRFTFTEADGIFQWDKLRSAYTLAEWSEPYFNNRALFSDYYLKERLTDERLTPAWGENVRPIGRQVLNHLTGARATYTGKAESVIRRGLFEPLFRALGFQWVENRAGSSTAEEADYLLYADEGRERPIALALTSVWNRNLDDQDPARDNETADEIPGALVVSVLEKGAAPWVIVTNGKLWRLYSATADNKATNYYEIDLEEALSAPEQMTALKYWWLFFRREAFTGFLDGLLQQSADYARALRERLKDRVFTEIFPHFAAGFIADIRRQVGHKRADFDEEVLELVYKATLTFLYRLMFGLYAESLELLPLNEERGYRQHSLYRLKGEIAAAAGTIADEAAGQLKEQYSTSSTELYERLQTLFEVIDTGDANLNLPTYNGGLFSQSSESGEFLVDYAIPDRYLALGLDRLCRDVDDKTQGLVFIDYKSLGVRQLGSIYEGLLEFKLRIAGEKLAVVKDKGREVYVPQAKAKGRVYATLDKGDVYLENDKQERKATGSYYTPDYIVKYIVEHTVGPVLARRFEALEPRLREGQKQFRRHRDLVKARGNDQPVELFWDMPEMRVLADACLDVRVLDPAMGSGHFLVEAVDFVSNRLIDFLNGWSENPVWGLLERIRDDILEEMESQKVSIDPARLTRVSLLKRAVLKRCIYGVDLNEMAVELAKVALWLDAFTLGAPLSFLDHHLKHGNSLIGARVQEVREALEAKRGEQLSLLAQSKFTGMMLATDLMRQVSYLSDNTVAQVTESRQAYRDARDHLAPYKRVLDVYTSRWFGNAPSKSGFDYAVEFLKRDDTQLWIENPETTRLPKKDYMNVAEVAETALDVAEEKRLFHWELEFPEVFFAPGKPGGQDVQLLKDGGFDAVIGNPPYDELSAYDLGREVSEKDYLNEASIYEPAQASGGRLNWYHYFMVIGVKLLQPYGLSGFIVPLSWVGDSFTLGVRKWLIENHTPILIEAFPQKDNPYKRVFFDAKLPTSLYVVEKDNPRHFFSVRVHPGREILAHPHYEANIQVIKRLNPETWLIPLVTNEEWKILTHIANDGSLGTFQEDGAEPTSGEIIFNASTRPFMTSDDSHQLILRGSHVQRYELAEKAKQGTPEYLKLQEYLNSSSKESKAYALEKPRVVYQEGSAIDAWRRVIPTYLPKGHVCGHKICYFVNYKVDMFTLLAIYASNLINWLVERLSATNSLPAYLIGNLPFPKFVSEITPEEKAAYLRTLKRLYSEAQYNAIANKIPNLAGSSVVAPLWVHDLLSFLAQEMISLNKAKQNEINEFLQKLQDFLDILPYQGREGIGNANSFL